MITHFNVVISSFHDSSDESGQDNYAAVVQITLSSVNLGSDVRDNVIGPS
jgi:hypothetical protein